MKRKKYGKFAWVGLAGYVAIYDYYAIRTNNETLSEAFGRSLMHPVGRWLTLTSVTLTLKHLLTPTLLPQLDPFARLATKWRKGVEMIIE